MSHSYKANDYRVYGGRLPEDIILISAGSTSANSPGVIFAKSLDGKNCGVHLQTQHNGLFCEVKITG
jgi:hypothetical protein